MIKRDLYYERIPTKSLREDVRYLGDILGRVIKKQEGKGFFKLVEDGGDYVDLSATIWWFQRIKTSAMSKEKYKQ